MIIAGFLNGRVASAELVRETVFLTCSYFPYCWCVDLMQVSGGEIRRNASRGALAMDYFWCDRR